MESRIFLLLTGHNKSLEAAAFGVSRSVQIFLFEALKLRLPENSWCPNLGAARELREGSISRAARGEEIMLGIIAAFLIICWLLGLFAFHVTSGLIHIVLVVGIILLILHFVSGRRVSV
jgi:hypothetical protein